MPATLEPPIRMKLTDVEFSATAFSTASFGTTIGINDCRTGWLNAIAVPLTTAVTITCHSSTKPAVTATPRKICVAHVTACVVRSTCFRFIRSATAPAMSPNTRIGAVRAASTTDSHTAESVSASTSTDRAMTSIQSVAEWPVCPSQRYR